MPFARPIETGRTDDSKNVMFAQVIATLGKHAFVTDDDILLPEDWRDAQTSQGSSFGHQPSGRTICLHSFCVCPETRGIGLGKSAMKAYIQMMNQSDVADRIALICKKVRYLLFLYESLSLLMMISRSSASSVGLVFSVMVGVKRLWQVLIGITWYVVCLQVS